MPYWITDKSVGEAWASTKSQDVLLQSVSRALDEQSTTKESRASESPWESPLFQGPVWQVILQFVIFFYLFMFHTSIYVYHLP